MSDKNIHQKINVSLPASITTVASPMIVVAVIFISNACFVVSPPLIKSSTYILHSISSTSSGFNILYRSICSLITAAKRNGDGAKPNIIRVNRKVSTCFLPDPASNESVRLLGPLFGREFARMLVLSRQLLPRDRTYFVSARSKAGSVVEGRFRDTR